MDGQDVNRVEERPGRKRVTHHPGKEHNFECTQPAFQSASGRKLIMMQACIAHGVKGSIIKLDLPPLKKDQNGQRKGGGMGGKEYVEQVLHGPLKNFVKEMESCRGCEILVVEDGAPGHKSVLAKAARNKLGIKQLLHPLSSPDLNPEEPLWLKVKNCVADLPGSANSLDKLWAAVQKIWDTLTVEDIEAHTGQMDMRVQAVKQETGKHTRF